MLCLYETDFYAWTQEQVSLLKARQWQQLDAANLIEEIETLGRKERQELRNRLALLLGHLLKWQFQPEGRSNSWLGTIREQRIQIKLLIEDSPSLKPYLPQAFLDAYELGLSLAIRETELGDPVFRKLVLTLWRKRSVLLFYPIRMGQLDSLKQPYSRFLPSSYYSGFP